MLHPRSSAALRPPFFTKLEFKSAKTSLSPSLASVFAFLPASPVGLRRTCRQDNCFREKQQSPSPRFHFFAFNSSIRGVLPAILTACARNGTILQLAFGDTELLRLASLPLGIAGDSVFVFLLPFFTLNRSEMGIQFVRFKRWRKIFLRDQVSELRQPKKTG